MCVSCTEWSQLFSDVSLYFVGCSSFSVRFHYSFTHFESNLSVSQDDRPFLTKLPRSMRVCHLEVYDSLWKCCLFVKCVNCIFYIVRSHSLIFPTNSVYELYKTSEQCFNCERSDSQLFIFIFCLATIESRAYIQQWTQFKSHMTKANCSQKQQYQAKIHVKQ